MNLKANSIFWQILPPDHPPYPFSSFRIELMIEKKTTKQSKDPLAPILRGIPPPHTNISKSFLQQRTSSPPSSCNSNSRETLRPEYTKLIFLGLDIFLLQISERQLTKLYNTWGKCGLVEIFSSIVFNHQKSLFLLLPLLSSPLLLTNICSTAVSLLGEEEAVAMDLLKPGWL